MPRNSNEPQPSQDAAPELRIAVMRLARRMRLERQDDRLTPSQLAVLGTLMREGPTPPATLAAREHVRPPSMTRIIAALEQDGWVVKQPHPQDGRQLLVELTDQARGWISASRKQRDHWLSDRLEQLDPGEVEILIRAAPLLNRLATMP